MISQNEIRVAALEYFFSKTHFNIVGETEINDKHTKINVVNQKNEH